MMGETAMGQPRTAEELDAAEAAIASAAGTLCATKGRMALFYSGGAESGLLLHLLRPLRDVLTVVWSDPGTVAGDAEHVMRQAGGWPHFVRVPVDRVAVWREHGLPSHLVPTALDPATRGDKPPPPIFVQSNITCCGRVRNLPAFNWCNGNGVSLVIHGQRRGEGSPMFRQEAEVGTWAPLANWTRADVMARVAHHGVPLPPQYREGYPKSFECAVCPADMDPARLGFLRRHHPEHHADTVRIAQGIMGAVDHYHGEARRMVEAAGA